MSGSVPRHAGSLTRLRGISGLQGYKAMLTPARPAFGGPIVFFPELYRVDLLVAAGFTRTAGVATYCAPSVITGESQMSMSVDIDTHDEWAFAERPCSEGERKRSVS